MVLTPYTHARAMVLVHFCYMDIQTCFPKYNLRYWHGSAVRESAPSLRNIIATTERGIGVEIPT